MKSTIYLLVVLTFLSSHASFAQQNQGEWLIGHWEGKIDYDPGSKADPNRVLRVHSIFPDGKLLARWAITGKTMVVADGTVDGSQANLVIPSSKSVVALTRDGDESLVGKITFSDGKTRSIKLTKTKLTTGFDGEWEGHISVFQGCGSSYYKITVKDSLITGSLQIAYSGFGQSEFYDSAVTGEVNGAGTAEIEIRGKARNSSFSGTFSSTEFRASDPPVGNRGCAYEVVLKRTKAG